MAAREYCSLGEGKGALQRERRDTIAGKSGGIANLTVETALVASS